MEMFITIASIVIPILAGIGAFFVRSIMSRIEKLEQDLNSVVTETQVRQMLSDKLDPVKEDMTEIKDSIKRLFELYFKRGR
jgi:flagellar motor component MotA